MLKRGTDDGPEVIDAPGHVGFYAGRTGDLIEVLPPGRLLIRNICMVFDHYLPAGGASGSFSKVI